MASRRLFDGAQIEIGSLPIVGVAAGGVSGTLATTTPIPSAVITGAHGVSGTLATTTPIPSAVITGAHGVSGSLVTTAPTATLAASGTVGSLAVTGTLTASAPVATLNAVGLSGSIEPPVVRPPRSTGGYAMPIPIEVVDPYEQIRLQDDRDLVDVINILMAVGVFHGKPH